MGKNSPCSSKTKISSSSSKRERLQPVKKLKNDRGAITVNGKIINNQDPTNNNNNNQTRSTPLKILKARRRSIATSSSPSPQPTIKFNGPLPLNPIADQVPENDFQDLQRPKDVSTDPDSVRSYLQNELLKEKLLPENEKGRRRYTPRHINDSGTIGSFEDLTVASNDTEEIIDTNDIVQTDDIIANNENVQTNEIIDNNENVETVEDPVNFDKITEPNSQKKFIFISAKNINKIDDEDDETRLAKVPTPPKKRRIEARDPPAPPETQLPPRRIFLELIEAQNNMDRISRERERELQSKRPTFVPEYIDPKQMILAKRNAKKGTFLSHNGKNKLTANPETGIIFHPYRLPGKPEPFSKESALHCYKYVDTKPPYLDREKLYWKSLNMGPPPHDYHQKDIDGKPRKAAPTKEYFQRILGGRPRSHSCTTYSENESIYIEKNKLDKDKPKESRRSKSADPPPCSRNKLFIKYMMRKFTIPNLNMEAQLIFSFLRKYETGKYFQVFCIFWAEYYKRVEIRCRKEGKEFETPTIWNVIPYENKRLSEADTAKIAPEPTRINTKPWINDYVNRVLNFFYYDEKPSIPVIQPLHEQLTKHPLIISSAKSKLKHLVYEQLSMKQFFFNLLNGNEEARKIWIARKNVLKQTRLIEKRFFGIEGINDFLPQQFRAKTVSQIPEDHRIFLNDQNGWLLERMIEIRTDEEIKRKKEEEKLRKVALRKAAIVSEEAKRKASGLSPVKPPPPKKAARKKPAGKKRKSKGGQSQKLVSKEPPLTKGRKRTHSEGVDENDENQIIAQCSKSHERDFSPELTASYFSQYDSSFMDQSFASESSAAFEDTTIPFEDFTTDIMECEKEITKEISLELPDSSAEAVFVYPQTQKIVCDPLVTKAISKKKVFIETTFKASKQRERIKHTVPIKSKAKVKARIVVSSKTKSVDFEFKKSCQKEKIVETIYIPLKVKTALKIAEPSFKNIDVEIPLIGPSVNEKAPEQLPKDIMRQTDKISFTVDSYKKPTEDIEMGEIVESADEVFSVVERKEDEEICRMEVQQHPSNVKSFDLNEVYEQIMIPRDILKRSSSVEVLPKFVVIKNARSASVAKDHRFSTKKDSLNIITLEPDDFNNFDDVQYKDVNIDEKESGKAVQIPQDDFTNTQGSSGGNEAFNYDDEDISQLLCNIDDNILFNLDEAESLLAEDQVISETMDYTPDANSADKVVDERPSEAMPSNEHFNDLPTSEEKGISNTGNDKEESVILKDAEIEHLTPPEVVDHCEGIQKSPVIIATIESEASTSLPKTFSVPDAVHGDPKSSTVSDLETPLTFENLMKVSLKNEGNKIRAYTEYMFLEDALNGSKTLQTQQLLKQRDSPYYAFKVGQNLVVNCGKVGETKNYRQAVISNNGEKCQVYDFLKDEWVARLQITANNILLFNMPFGTRRSQLGIKRFPRSDGDTECEVVVYKHVFGEWLKTDGSLDTVYCYYTVLGGKLILLYDIGQEYLFDLLWAPYLYYFTFSTEDNHVFKEVVLESYNLMFDTKNSPTTLLIDDIKQDNIFFIRRKLSKSSAGQKSVGQQTMKSSSRSGGGSTTSDKHRSISQGTASDAAATARHSSSTTTKEKQPDNDRKRHHQQQRYQRIKQLKISPIPLNDCSFDSSNPQLVLHYDKFITEPLKYHRRLMVGHEHAFLMKDHQKLISHYAIIFVDKIQKYSKVNQIYTEKLKDLPSLMIKLGTAMLFTEEKDIFAIEPVDEKLEDTFRTFMGNIIAVSLCDAMRILSCLFTKTSPNALNKVIIDFHTGNRFKFASSKLTYCKPEPDWRLLDNALALSIFEYSKDSSTLTFFFIRHLINAFKYGEFLEQPDIVYTKYYSNVIDFQSPFYFAERILTDIMGKFYDYIANKIVDLPEFPPNKVVEKISATLIPSTNLKRCISVYRNTFKFKYQYNSNTFKLNTIIPREMFSPRKLNIIPLEIQCYDSDGNDYFLDPVIPKWIFMINNNLIIHPATYRVLYHTFKCAKIYLFPFDDTQIPFFNTFMRSNNRLDFYALLKSGMPIKVTDICTQPFVHATRFPFYKTDLTGVHEARGWIKEPYLLDVDYESGILHLTWKTVCTILRARNELGLLSSENSSFLTLSTDVIRRFRLHEFQLETKLKIYIPNPATVKRATFVPIPDSRRTI